MVNNLKVLPIMKSCFLFILAAFIFYFYMSSMDYSLQFQYGYKFKTKAIQENKENANRSVAVDEAYEGNLHRDQYASTSVVKPWFMDGGTIRPVPPSTGLNGRRNASVWPEERPGHDRIVDQLMFVPRNGSVRFKVVLMYNGLSSWPSSVRPGRMIFSNCPVDKCLLKENISDAEVASAIIFKNNFSPPTHDRRIQQVWIVFILECPHYTQPYQFKDLFNWTATYRTDSDLVTPYDKWVYYNERIKQLKTPIKNFAANKTKQVAWFVSHCSTRNKRFQYAGELQKYIDVDIYGVCGPLKCPKSMQSKCFEILRKEYKFYLSFENANCRGYITEKFYTNALRNDVLPIVMGARPQDYELVAPMKSYIHVDDFESPKQLAEYLHKLDSDDNLYNEYFRWKGTGEFINTHFFCRVCALLHDQYPNKSYRDINEWWRSVGTCRSGSWRLPEEITEAPDYF